MLDSAFSLVYAHAARKATKVEADPWLFLFMLLIFGLTIYLLLSRILNDDDEAGK